MREQTVRCNDKMNGKRDTVGKNNSDLFFLRAGKFERGWGDERWERGNADEEEGRSERANNRAGRTVCGLSFSFFALLCTPCFHPSTVLRLIPRIYAHHLALLQLSNAQNIG
jgi:hypothetical protein